MFFSFRNWGFSFEFSFNLVFRLYMGQQNRGCFWYFILICCGLSCYDIFVNLKFERVVIFVKRTIVKLLSFVFIIIMMMTMLTACGIDSDKYDSVGNMGFESDSVINSGSGFGNDWVSEGKSEYNEVVPDDVESVRKIIERIDLSVQTKAFDTLMTDIDARVDEFGGYVESSNIQGNGFDSYGGRDACVVIRIPADKSDAFVNFVSENSAVVSKNVDTEDVTLQYVDVESRINVLLLEKTQLEQLLSEAVTMEDIIYVQDRLMDVIYELESAQSQLRTYDDLIDYTTITLNICEVERTVIVEKQTVWEEIATKFTNNIDDIKADIVELFIYVVANSPYLLIYAIVIFVGIVFIKKANKKAKSNVNFTVDVSQKANVTEDVNVVESDKQ